MAKTMAPKVPTTFGSKVGTLKSLKKSLKSNAGRLRYIPKQGSLTVRFLEEPENWVNFSEHYDQQMRKSYPCIGQENNCPGCATDERKSSRYLANALDVDKGVVIALQLPKDLTNSLVRKYDRFDTLCDRDYVLSRDGEGLDTEYDADAEAPMKRKVTQFVLLDLQEQLALTYNDVFGDGDDEDAEPAKSKSKAAPAAKGTRGKSKAAQALDDEDEEEDEEDPDEEEEDEAPPAKSKGKKMTPPARDADDDEDDDEDEDEEEEDPDDEDDDEDEDEDDDPEDDEDDDGPTREELEAMSLGQLRVLAKEYEDEDGEPLVTTGLKKAQIIDMLVGPEDDED